MEEEGEEEPEEGMLGREERIVMIYAGKKNKTINKNKGNNFITRTSQVTKRDSLFFSVVKRP